LTGTTVWYVLADLPRIGAKEGTALFLSKPPEENCGAEEVIMNTSVVRKDQHD